MSFRSSGKQTPKALLGGILWKMRKEGGEEELGFGGALGGRPCAVLHWASRSGSRTLHAWPLAGSTTSVRVGHVGSRRGGRRGSTSRPLEPWAPGYEPSAQERQEAYFFRPLTRGCQQGCHLVTCGPRFLTWAASTVDPSSEVPFLIFFYQKRPCFSRFIGAWCLPGLSEERGVTISVRCLWSWRTTSMGGFEL